MLVRHQVLLAVCAVGTVIAALIVVAKASTPDSARERVLLDIRVAMARMTAGAAGAARDVRTVGWSRRVGSYGLGVALPLNCSGADILQRTKHFVTGSEQNPCASEAGWLQMMQAESPTVRDKVFVNVGCWKGYEVLQWLEIWAPHYLAHRHITRAKWIAALPPGCGYCGQCNAPQRTAYLAWDVLREASGTRPAAPRIFAYEPLRSMQPSLRKLRDTFNLSDHVFFGDSAFGAAVGRGQFPDCPLDREDCGIDTAVGVERVPVNVTTVDAEFAAHGWGHVDVLSVDTEGNDYPVLMQGARATLSGRHVDVLGFEYHAVGAWRRERLEVMVAQLDAWGYDCWFAGKTGTWRITGCWDARFEFHANSRVWCALRSSRYRWIFENMRAPFAKLPG